MDGMADEAAPRVSDVSDDAQDQTPADKALVVRIVKAIKADKRHHEKAMKQMKRDMRLAKYGRPADWAEGSYVANFIGRLVKGKTAALYAKNPKAVFKRRPSLDFAIWDENPDTLKLAMTTIQNAAVAAQQPPEQQGQDLNGMPEASATQLPAGFEQAQQLLQDFQQGQQRRDQLTKIGKTLEILFAHATREQKPLDFKTALKKLVRRACTTGVGYVEINFQRETGPRPGLAEQLADARVRLDHLENLAQQAADEEIGDDDAEMAELRQSIEALQAEPEILLREGLVFDFPQATKVIPDRLCKELVGFVGARHLTVEYLYTRDEVAETFKVDLNKGQWKSYDPNGKIDDGEQPNKVSDDEVTALDNEDGGLVCVWKHYDKPSGLVYYVADGYAEFLRKPAAPDVFVTDFWPVYALTFNDVEHEDELFPPSDVFLMSSMQEEYNRSRQGQREHRQAARPRFGHAKGSIDEQTAAGLMNAAPFSNTPFNVGPSGKVADLMQPLPVPGVDPNLYETAGFFADTQIVVGASEAQFGGTSKATATESAIAANSNTSSDGASVDDLDGFLSVLARASGQILLKEMSQEQVMRVVGPGAVWPDVPLADIADELYLDVQAGSTSKPNQAVEINNWSTLLPFLIQMPEIQKFWLAKETIRRLDDTADLDEAVAAGLPSIVAQNAMAAAAPGAGGAPQPDAGPTPQSAQGMHGGANAPQPPAPSGSGPQFGSNQVPRGGA